VASYSNAVTGQPKLEGKIVDSLALQLQHEDAGLGVCTKHSMHIAFGLSPVCFYVCAAKHTLKRRTRQRASSLSSRESFAMTLPMAWLQDVC
jgi:hypothetical protein